MPPTPDWTSDKPFAGPDDPVTSTCWDCGYTWVRGLDGSHDCVAELKALCGWYYVAKRAIGAAANTAIEQRNTALDRVAELEASVESWKAAHTATHPRAEETERGLRSRIAELEAERDRAWERVIREHDRRLTSE